MNQAASEIQDQVLATFGRFDIFCSFNENVAGRIGGWLYRTDENSKYGSFFNLAIGRIETSNKGQIIDISSPDFFVGIVKNVSEINGVLVQLERKYHISGWYLVSDFSKKSGIYHPNKSK